MRVMELLLLSLFLQNDYWYHNKYHGSLAGLYFNYRINLVPRHLVPVEPLTWNTKYIQTRKKEPSQLACMWHTWTRFMWHRSKLLLDTLHVQLSDNTESTPCVQSKNLWLWHIEAQLRCSRYLAFFWHTPRKLATTIKLCCSSWNKALQKNSLLENLPSSAKNW